MRADGSRPRCFDKAACGGDQNLCWGQAREYRLEGDVIRHLSHQKAPAAEVKPREPISRFGYCNREDQCVLFGIEQGFVGEGAGRNDTHNLTIHRTFACSGVAGLFCNRDGLAGPDQLGEITLRGVIGHARHRDRLPGRFPSARKGDVQDARSGFSIVVEELIEITHAIKQQFARVRSLDREVLLHHRSVCG